MLLVLFGKHFEIKSFVCLISHTFKIRQKEGNVLPIYIIKHTVII